MNIIKNCSDTIITVNIT